MGIAVGMASNICSFNLQDVCRTAIALIKNRTRILLDTLPAPDFPTGGEILYDASEMLQNYNTGRGTLPPQSQMALSQGRKHDRNL